MQTSLRPIVSLLLGVALLMIGVGLQFTLLPLRGTVEGFSSVELGVIASAYYLGFITGCLLAPYLILRAGHIRAFAAMVAVAAAAALGYALVPEAFAWLVMRLITGFCLAGFYLVIESWLNDGATNDSRGLVMSAYVVVNFGALAGGQMLVTIYPIGSSGGFMIAAVLSALAIVPVALTKSAQPAPITIVVFRPMQLYRAAPVALVASFMVGVAVGAFWGLAPLSAAGSGLGIEGVALFMTTALLAGALAQWPLGHLSDRIDRRLVLFAVLIGAALTGIALWLVPASTIVLLTFGFLFGAMTFPGYALAAAHGYDKTPASDMVSTAATILLVNALGASIGPLAASGVMSGVGPRGLFLFTAVVQALLAGYVLYRTRVQEPLPVPDKTEFDLATTAPVGAVVTSESLDPQDPAVAVPEAYTPPPPGSDATELVPATADEDNPVSTKHADADSYGVGPAR